MRMLPSFKRKSGYQMAGGGFDGGGGSTLSPATSETLGGVKIGNGINVTDDGTISVSGGSVDLDYFTTEVDTGTKWVDDKPIYKRTFTNVTKGYIQQVIDVSTFIKEEIIAHDNQTNVKMITQSSTAYQLSVYYVGGTTKMFYLDTASNMGNMGNITVTVYYTKND